MKYIWRRGGTFNFGLQIVAGTVVGDENVRCVLKPATIKGLSPGDDTPDACVFNVAFVEAEGNQLPYWLFTGSASDGEALDAGEYIADARITLGATIVQTTSVLVKVVERVTEGI